MGGLEGREESSEQMTFDEVFEDGDFELIERTIDEDGKEKFWAVEETIEVEDEEARPRGRFRARSRSRGRSPGRAAEIFSISDAEPTQAGHSGKPKRWYELSEEDMFGKDFDKHDAGGGGGDGDVEGDDGMEQ